MKFHHEKVARYDPATGLVLPERIPIRVFRERYSTLPGIDGPHDGGDLWDNLRQVGAIAIDYDAPYNEPCWVTILNPAAIQRAHALHLLQGFAL